MRHAQILVYEKDGKLAETLRSLGKSRGIWLREVRQSKVCLEALARGGASVLVIKVGRDLERELALLEQTSRNFPDCRTIVVGDVDHPALADLAWDLGAAFVLLPPTPLELLPESVNHLLSNEPTASDSHGEPEASATGART